MTEYRRVWVEGATYFFTVNCAERKGNHILIDNIDLMRAVLKKVKAKHPFEIDAIVVLPEHMHCIWTLPPGDADFKTRWALIKADFSRSLPKDERRSASRIKRGERGIWQRRFWEHLIRDDEDYQQHVDYIYWPLLRFLRSRHLCIPAHRNPVKHGLVSHVKDWPHSSFHAYVRRNIYSKDWGSEPKMKIEVGE